MKGDFSRLSFDKNNHFSRVLMQQGRVQLDSDWNEQMAILMHYMQSFVTDALHDPDTKLSHGGAGDGFLIIKEDQYYVTSGRYYVNGILCENYFNTLIPNSEPERVGLELNLDSAGDDEQVIYLEVWEQHVTAVENPNIKDPALNGLDTTTRTQIVWQVKAVNKSEIDGEAYDFDLLKPKTTAKLQLCSTGSTSNEPCPVSSQAQYRGFDNQLYRIEIHQGKMPDDNQTTPALKWSRENGSIAYPIDDKKSKDSTIRLKSLNPDPRWEIQPDDWVEIISRLPEEDTKNSNIPDRLQTTGQMAKVASVDFSNFTIGLTNPVDSVSEGAILRRWDHVTDASSGVIEITEDEKILLEDGISIKFSGDMSTFRAGDYWLIPARVGQSIMWPDDGAEPLGIERQYAPLALITTGSDKPEDKRRPMNPALQFGESITENKNNIDKLKKSHENHEEQQHGGDFPFSAEKSFQATEAVEAEPEKPAPKKRGRPRKSTKKTTGSDKSSKK